MLPPSLLNSFIYLLTEHALTHLHLSFSLFLSCDAFHAMRNVTVLCCIPLLTLASLILSATRSATLIRSEKDAEGRGVRQVAADRAVAAAARPRTRSRRSRRRQRQHSFTFPRGSGPGRAGERGVDTTPRCYRGRQR